MIDIMIDLETLDTANTAVIVQIGACEFNRITGEIGLTYEANIDIGLSLAEGFTVSGPTIYWWLNQTREARESISKAPLDSPKQAAIEFSAFMRGSDCIWCHTSFDIPIIENYFKLIALPFVFNYTKAMDIRTTKNLAGIDLANYESLGTDHTALDDCKFQVGYVVDAMKILKGLK